jgi:hypothetical protein
MIPSETACNVESCLFCEDFAPCIQFRSYDGPWPDDMSSCTLCVGHRFHLSDTHTSSCQGSRACSSGQPCTAAIGHKQSTGAGADRRRIHAADVPQLKDAVYMESFESRHSSHSTARRLTSKLGIKRQGLRLDSQCKYGLLASGRGNLFLRFPPNTYRSAPASPVAATAVPFTSSLKAIREMCVYRSAMNVTHVCRGSNKCCRCIRHADIRPACSSCLCYIMKQEPRANGTIQGKRAKATAEEHHVSIEAGSKSNRV